MDERFDEVVVGAGCRGLAAALRARRERPAASLLLVEAEPRPGGDVQTQRSNGFVCELGPFAFHRDEVEPLLALLPQPPKVVDLLPAAWRGSLFDGTGLREVAVEPRPISFASGNEELVQACRRELGANVRLGRKVAAVRPAGTEWDVELGGEAPTHVACGRLTLAVPTAAAAVLLGGLDRALPACAERLLTEQRAFVFLGGNETDAPELRGYGIVPTEGLSSVLAEAIFCTQAFAARALPGRFLVRCELVGEALAADDGAALAAAAAELRRWTGTNARFGFTKLHRFAADAEDGARVECCVRLQGLAQRAPGLTIL